MIDVVKRIQLGIPSFEPYQQLPTTYEQATAVFTEEQYRVVAWA
jgi:hypothetical protein